MDGWIVVRNWDRFQHYKNREPLWIKVYTELNSDPDWLGLSIAARGLLVTIWLEYARARGHLPLSKVLSLCRPSARRSHIESLSDAGFITIVASRTLALTRSREQEQEVDVEVDVKAKTVAGNTRTNPGQRELPADLVDQVAHLNGANDRTFAVLTSFVRKGLPEAAFRNALEATREAHNSKRLRGSEIAYFVGTLQQLANSGQYQ